jgi:hypothetical protein
LYGAFVWARRALNTSKRRFLARAVAGKWFVCRGTGPNVPKFLSFQGKVRNRNMQKGDAESLIKGFWQFKRTSELKKTFVPISIPDHLYSFLQSKYGVQATIVEMSYNLVDALKRYQHDADCELFHKILFGELCEDAYHSQLKMLTGLEKALHDLDRKHHGKKNAKGQLTRDQLISVVETHFPLKPDSDLRALKSALQYDQPLPVVSIHRLFEETRDGDQVRKNISSWPRSWPTSAFYRRIPTGMHGPTSIFWANLIPFSLQGKWVETLRDQNLYDCMSSYPAIDDAIRQVRKTPSWPRRWANFHLL